MGFPPDFLFGVATADHQCEAAVAGEDDIRDRWESVRGETPRGLATDFWNRYEEDASLAASLGCKAFRLSLSWARLEQSRGVWADEAFAHYRAVLQTLRDKGMKTVVTLHHNTWPLHVQAAGNGNGMLDPGFPDCFANYAREVGRRLGSLIDYCITFNEPNQLVFGFVKPWWSRSYAMPPGLDRYASGVSQMQAVQEFIPNLFLAHARGRKALREEVPGLPVGANPFILGMPPWFQTIINWNATRVRSRPQLQRQGERLGRRPLPQWGDVDVVLAQLTFDVARSDKVLLSEAYFETPAALLAKPGSATLQRIGVISGTVWMKRVHTFFPDVQAVPYDTPADAMQALSSGDIDGMIGDEVALQALASAAFDVRAIPNSSQPYCAAVGPGNRALINAVDTVIRDFKTQQHLTTGVAPTKVLRRATLADVGQVSRAADVKSTVRAIPHMEGSLERIRRRGKLRVGVYPGTPGLCTVDANGTYSGLEPDLARAMATAMFGGADGHLQFVELDAAERMHATQSRTGFLDPLLRVLTAFSTILSTDWWHLGLAGKLSTFLCPQECVGALDFVGLDYYWGAAGLSINGFNRLIAAAERRYTNAPVWPSGLYSAIATHSKMFPGLPIFVIENGCVTSADGVARDEYIRRHLREVERAIDDGYPVHAYLCWSITSNREWGLPFNNDSDFGLFHIDLDGPATLTRERTPAADAYAAIISDLQSSPTKD